MAESNFLGNFIKNRRKEKGFSNTTRLARRLGCSVGYLSRIERSAADGPSLKFMRELAQVLDVDVKDLVRLKEQDGRPEQLKASHNSTMQKEGDPRKSSYRGRMMGGDASHAMMPIIDYRTERTLLSKQLNLDRLGLRSDYKNLGLTLFDIAQKLLVATKLPDAEESKSEEKPEMRPLVAESLDVLALALALFERLNDFGGTAFTHFKVGRVHRSASFDTSLSTSEQLHHLREANYSFERAYAIFSEHLDELPDEYMERRPECAVQWARSDEEIAYLCSRSNMDQTDEFDSKTEAGIKEEYQRVILAFYLDRAKAKREAAVEQYQEWIATLCGRGEARDGNWEANMHRLAEAYHRLGVGCRDLAHASDDPQYSDRFYQKGIKAFHQALEHRKILALAFPDDPARTAEFLDRLANTHGQFGLSVQLQDNDSKATSEREDAVLKEEAFWQFQVSERLYRLLELAEEDPRVENARQYLVSIHTEHGLDSDILARQEIEAKLEATEFGTKTHPKLQYSVVYVLKPERLDEPQPAEARS